MNRVESLAREYWYRAVDRRAADRGHARADPRHGTRRCADTSLRFADPAGGPAGGAALRPQAVSLRGARVLLADRDGASRSSTERSSRSWSASFPSGWSPPSCSGTSATLRRAWAGLAIVLGGIITVVYNIPGHATAELVVIPVDFGISWAAGFALRDRAQKAEAAETRATQAEREREAAARVAVAEERARIARELHDIVAHAVSVMVLQVGRRQASASRRAGRAARGAHGRRARRPYRTRRDAPPARRDAPRRRRGRARAATRPRRHRLAAGRDRPGRLAGRAARGRRARSAPTRDRPLRVPHRPGGPDERAQARARDRR